jgi:hypothetical protein
MKKSDYRKQLEQNARDLRKSLASDEEPEDIAYLKAGLVTLFNTQMTVSSLVDGCIPEVGTHASPDQLRTYFLALMVEMMELLQELSWKPWKNEKPVNSARVADEFADVLAFLGVLIIYLDSLGVPPDMLAGAYAAKSRVNIERMLGMVPDYDKPKGH